MKWLFAPAVTILMHWRNHVKFTLAGAVFCVPLALALWGAPPAWDSARGIAIIAAFLFAWYYIGAMYLTSDEAWRTVNSVASRLSQHDLRSTRDVAQAATIRRRLGSGQFGRLYDALASTHENLSDLAGQARRSADTALGTADMLAKGGAQLAQRTEDQASTLEQTAAAMEELSSTVGQTAQNCGEASQKAAGATVAARQGARIAHDVIATMGRIEDASRKIVDIIGVIEGISFQTNILALNAAVEAARAGEHGRGFAVVAEEVRALSRRSAEAARQIGGLIGESVAQVEAGAGRVREAGTAIDNVVASVEEMNELLGVISIAAREEASGVDSVSRALAQLQGVTQENAHMVQSAGQSAMTLREEAARLSQLVGRFRLDEVPAGAAKPAPGRPPGRTVALLRG
jgi:methyl-accepting chemotaxis protein